MQTRNIAILHPPVHMVTQGLVHEQCYKMLNATNATKVSSNIKD